MTITPSQLSTLLAIPGAAQQLCDVLNSIASSQSGGTALTADASGNYTTTGDITTSGEMKATNLEVTGTVKFDKGLPAATTAVAGAVKMCTGMNDVVESTATDVTTLVTDHNTLVNKFNNLIGFLTQAGTMSSS